jgi:hypothetical protein
VEIRVEEDQCWPGDAEKHVRAEPRRNPAKPAKKARAFPQRVKQEKQHHQAAGYAEPVSKPRLGVDIAFVPVDPAKIEGADYGGGENKSAEVKKRFRKIMRESSCIYENTPGPAAWWRVPALYLAAWPHPPFKSCMI